MGHRRRLVIALASVASLVLGVVSAAGPRGLRQHARLRDEARALAQRNAELAAENERLRNEVRRLHQDPKAIERAAREDLGMVAKDEVVFTFE